MPIDDEGAAMDNDRTTIMNHRADAPVGEAASDATRVMGQGRDASVRGGHFAPRDPFADTPESDPFADSYAQQGYSSSATYQDDPVRTATPSSYNAVPPTDRYGNAASANPYASAAPSETVMMPGAAARRGNAAAPVNARPVEPATGYFPYSEHSRQAERRSLFGRSSDAQGYAARPLERVPFSGLAKACIAILIVLAVVSVASSIVTGFINGGSAANGATTGTATAQANQSGTVDLSDIPGQYWSNAKKILTSRGADVDNAVVLTDDGSTPLIASNWMVQSIYYNDNGNLEVNLTRSGSGQSGDASTGGAVTDALEDLGGQAQNAWNALQNGILGAAGAQ